MCVCVCISGLTRRTVHHHRHREHPTARQPPQVISRAVALCIRICVYMCVCVCVCIYICVCVCVYIYIYIYTGNTVPQRAHFTGDQPRRGTARADARLPMLRHGKPRAPRPRGGRAALRLPVAQAAHHGRRPIRVLQAGDALRRRPRARRGAARRRAGRRRRGRAARRCGGAQGRHRARADAPSELAD